MKNTRIDWGNVVVPNIQYGITYINNIYKYITVLCTGYLPMIGTEIVNPHPNPCCCAMANQWHRHILAKFTREQIEGYFLYRLAGV